MPSNLVKIHFRGGFVDGCNPIKNPVNSGINMDKLPTLTGLVGWDRYQQSAKPPSFKVAKLWLGCDGLGWLDWLAWAWLHQWKLTTPRLIPTGPTGFWKSSCSSGSILSFGGVQLKLINSFKRLVRGQSIWFQLFWPFPKWLFSRFAWEAWIRVQVLYHQYHFLSFSLFASSVTFCAPAFLYAIFAA